MRNLFQIKNGLLLAAAFGFAACQPPTTTVNGNQSNAFNSNINSSNMNLSNANNNMTNVNSNAGSASAVEASEPEQYRGTVTLKLEAGGNDRKTTLPAITAQVARSGDNRRMEFTLPNGEKVIYLDLGGKQLVVSPQRKQYAELDKESLGINVRRLMMPAEIVSRVKAMNGVERVGEEKYNGRDAVKYQYNAVTDTKTQAGNVNTESVLYVDKETGLPLHSETSSASQSSSVNGINNARLITEMTNLQTNADASLFAEPTNYQKVAPEQLRQQLEVIFNVVGTFIGQAMQSQTAASPSPVGSPK